MPSVSMGECAAWRSARPGVGQSACSWAQGLGEPSAWLGGRRLWPGAPACDVTHVRTGLLQSAAKTGSATPRRASASSARIRRTSLVRRPTTGGPDSAAITPSSTAACARAPSHREQRSAGARRSTRRVKTSAREHEPTRSGPPRASAGGRCTLSEPVAAAQAGVSPPALHTVLSPLCRWRADLFRLDRPQHDLLINEPATVLLDKLPVEA